MSLPGQSCGICGRQRDTGTGSSPELLGFPLSISFHRDSPYISFVRWTKGPLVAAVQRRSLTLPTWTTNWKFSSFNKYVILVNAPFQVSAQSSWQATWLRVWNCTREASFCRAMGAATGAVTANSRHPHRLPTSLGLVSSCTQRPRTGCPNVTCTGCRLVRAISSTPRPTHSLSPLPTP
jgi:hypothetical protein